MPEFSTVFSVKHNDRKLKKEELIRAIRFNIAAEYEAIQLYEQLIESIDDEQAIKVLKEVVNDEKIHVGCFRQMLKLLSSDDSLFEKAGEKEIKEILNL